jgi:hypothetical protein
MDTRGSLDKIKGMGDHRVAPGLAEGGATENDFTCVSFEGAFATWWLKPSRYRRCAWGEDPHLSGPRGAASRLVKKMAFLTEYATQA